MDPGAAGGRRRRWVIVVGAVVAHLCVLTLLGLEVPRTEELPIDPSKAMCATLVRLPANAVPHTAAAPSSPRNTRLAHSLPPVQASEPSPSRAATPSLMASAPATGPSPSYAPGSQPYGDEGRGVQALLRGMLACAHSADVHLANADKARCNQQLLEAARKTTPFSGIPPEKRQYFDAVAERYKQLRDPTPPARGGLPGALGLIKQPAFVMPGPACGMKFGPDARKKKDNRSLTDRIKDDGFASIDIGPLKCGIAVPVGPLSPEVGIPQP